MTGARGRMIAGALVLASLFSGCSQRSLLPLVLGPQGAQVGPVAVLDGGVDCSLGRAAPVIVGWSKFRAALGAPARRGGYGWWSYGTAPFDSESKPSDPARLDHMVGEALVVRDARSAWVLVTMDTIGIPDRMSVRWSEVLAGDVRDHMGEESARAGETAEEGAPPCVMVTFVASHSHSSADLTGLWGGVSDGWVPAQNRERAAAKIEEPVLAAMRSAVDSAWEHGLPSQIHVGHGFVPTVADKETHGVGSRNLTALWIAHVSEADHGQLNVHAAQKTIAPERQAVVWVWNGHAATDDPSDAQQSGDFPAEVRESLSSDAQSFFLPGVIGGDYPIEEPGWRSALVEEIRLTSPGTRERPLTAGASETVIVLKQRDMCFTADHRGVRLLEAVFELGGGEPLAQCPQDAEGERRRAVRLQSVRIAVAGSEPQELVFVPFEAFAAVEAQAGTILGRNVRFVSLANGFGGHGLLRAQVNAVISGSGEPGRARPYHLFLALLRGVDDLMGVFLSPKP